VTRRDGTIPQVHILQFDDDFEHASGLHGIVSFEVHAQGDLRPDGKLRKRQTGSASETQSVSLVNEAFTLFEDELMCLSPFGEGSIGNEAIQGGVAFDQTTFSITVDMVSRGSVNPPSVSALSFSAPTTANIAGVAGTVASLQGTMSVIGVELMNTPFLTFSIQGILTISPSFTAEASVVGFVELQTLSDADVNFNIAINNLQFTYPSNSPAATVNVIPSSAPIEFDAQPNVNANAQFGVNLVFQLLVQVSAFSQSVDLTVTYNLGHDLDMQATPAATANNVEVCFSAIQTFSIQVANSGPFLQAFAQANSQTIFEDGNSVLSKCQVVALAPPPPSDRRARSPLYRRDSVSCPPVAAIAQNLVSFDGSFP